MDKNNNIEKVRLGITKKDGAVIESGVVIQNIVIRPVQRTQLDLQQWRKNWQAAEGYINFRIPLYDMYDDMLADGFLKRLIEQRILGVTKHNLKYVDKASKEVTAAKKFINLRQFRKLRNCIQLQKAWGISVIELTNDNGVFKCFDVPKKHIKPDEGLIVKEQFGTEGFCYREAPYNKTVLEVGEWDDLGYLLQACAYAIYKRGVIGDWANYAQVFGTPLRIGRYDGFNEGVRLQMENALEKAGSAAYMVLPKEAEIQVLASNTTAASNQLYDTLRKAMNEEMTVLILGATETTTSSDSSGYAQSKTHKKTVDELALDDKLSELSVLNEDVLKILVTLGLLPAGGKFIYDSPFDLDKANDLVDIALSMKNAGVPVGDDYLYNVTGVDKPKNYEELKTRHSQKK